MDVIDVAARARDQILAALVNAPPYEWVLWTDLYRRLPESVRPVSTTTLADLIAAGVVRERRVLRGPGEPARRYVRLADHYDGAA